MATPTAVLGVSAYYHDSAAALVIDGQPVAAAQQERFCRHKGCDQLPTDAIDFCLRQHDLVPADLSSVVFYESPFAKFDRLLATYLQGQLSALPAFVAAMRTWLPTKLWVENHLRGHLGRTLGKQVPLLFSDHHLSHAASAFYPSPFNQAAVLTVDGVGEWSTTCIADGRYAELVLLEHIEWPNSLGMLYSAVTRYCGFKINSGEYKLMGLAPYGDPRYVERIREQLIHLADDGSFALNPAYFDYTRRLRTYNQQLETLFDAPTAPLGAKPTRHTADVAASIQQVTDQAMIGLANRAAASTGHTRLCLAGGVALNVVSVAAIERGTDLEQVWVQPAAGDAGGALGAALWACHQEHGVARETPPTPDGMAGAFLGPTPGEPPTDHHPDAADPLLPATTNTDRTAAVLASYQLHAQHLDDDELADQLAARLAAGATVALARGRAEFGPRALGARSILADPRDPSTHRRLNLQTKFREGFRPFAPVVLRDKAADWFDLGQNDRPYMLATDPVTAAIRTEPAPRVPDDDLAAAAVAVRSQLPAITHLDFSARTQTADPERHPFLHRLLARFDARTGCPVLVNTSFNVRGEPIVTTAGDAVECFLAAQVDLLVIDNWLVDRHLQPPSALVARRPSARSDD